MNAQVLCAAPWWSLALATVLALPPVVFEGCRFPLREGGGAALQEDGGVAVEDSVTVIDDLIEAAGGWDTWSELDGLRYDVLERVRFMANRKTQRWEVATLVPMLAQYTLEGDGFLLQEFTNESQTGPEYRRVITIGGDSWAELGGKYRHDQQTILNTFATARREFFLGAMPFSLRVLGGTAKSLGKIEVDGVELDSYRIRLEQPVIMFEKERIRGFTVFVDPSEMRIVRMRFTLRGYDRDAFKNPEAYAQVDFEDYLEVEGIRLAGQRRLYYDNPQRVWEWEVADVMNEAVPPASLRKPWLTAIVWTTDDRADAWDPIEDPDDAE